MWQPSFVLAGAKGGVTHCPSDAPIAANAPRRSDVIPSRNAASLPALSEPVRALHEELTQRQVRASSADADRLSYARDSSSIALLFAAHGELPPPHELVVWPKDEEEVALVIQLARKHAVPLIPFGAGSGVSGGTWAVKGGVALDLKRLERISPVDPARREVRVQAGVIGEVLERRLAPQGFTVGHFPASIAMSTVGGWLAARSAGQLASRYGKIEDRVVSLSAVSGRGERFETPRRPHPGVDLASLLIGSEGTLCAFTDVTLRVDPAPEHRAFRAYRFRSMEQGFAAARALFVEGLRPAVARLFDPVETALFQRGKEPSKTPPSLRSAMDSELLPALLRKLSPVTVGKPSLLNRAGDLLRETQMVVIFEGARGKTEADHAAARQLCTSLGGNDAGEGPARLWFERRHLEVFRSSPLLERGAFIDSMDVAVTWDKAQDVYERVRASVSPLAVVRCQAAHPGLHGCSLEFTVVTSEADLQQQRQRYEKLWRTALTAAVSAGATVSHHGGIGLLRSEAYRDSLGDRRRALSALKRAFDPDGILNPGKLAL